MEDNLDILKQKWQHLAARTEALEEANRELAEKLAGNRTTSLQERLARRNFNILWFGLVLPVLAPLLHYELSMPWWVCVLYGLFGVAMSLMSLMLSEYIRAVPLTELPVAAAIERASKIKIRQARDRLIGIVLGTVLIATMFFVLPEGPEREPIIIGGSVGLAVGLVFGVVRCVVNERLARELIRSLK